MLIPVAIQQRCVKVERQFTFIDRWELEVLLIYWGFYSMTPTTPSPKKAFRTNFFPRSLLFILLFLIVHCEEVVPLQLNLIYFVLYFCQRMPRVERMLIVLSLYAAGLKWFSVVYPFSHMFQVTHRFMNMMLTFKFCQIKK